MKSSDNNSIKFTSSDQQTTDKYNLSTDKDTVKKELDKHLYELNNIKSNTLNLSPKLNLPECQPVSVSEFDSDGEDQSEIDTSYYKKPKGKFRGYNSMTKSVENMLEQTNHAQMQMYAKQQIQVESLQKEVSNLVKLLQDERNKNYDSNNYNKNNKNKKNKTIIDPEMQVYKNQYDLIQELVKNNDILCSEATYFDIKKIPENDRSLRQLIQCKFIEMQSNYKKDNNKLNKDNEILKENLMLTTDKFERNLREYEHIKKQYNSLKTDYKNKCNHQEENERELLKSLDSKMDNVKKITMQSKKYEDEVKKNSELIFEIERLKNSIEIDQSNIKQINLEKNTFQKELDLVRKENDLLKNDKIHLKKESEHYMDSYKKSEDRIVVLENKLTNVKKSKNELHNKILDLQQYSNNKNLESHFSKELEKLQNASKSDIENMKKNMEDVYEREIRNLKESRENAMIQQEKMQNKLSEKESLQDGLTIEYRTIRAKLEIQIHEYIGENKLKSFELERLKLQYEEIMNNFKQGKIENSLINEKFELLKGEYHRLESQQKTENADLRAELCIKKEQLNNQLDMEKELDHTIMNTKDENIHKILESVPSRGTKRIQQCVKLANLLSIKTKEQEKISNEIDYKNKQIEKQQTEILVFKQTMDKSNQPQSFLIKDIEDNQLKIIELKKNNEKLISDLAYANEEKNMLKKHKTEMEKDLIDLTSKRKIVDALQVKLEAMIKASGRTQKETEKENFNKNKIYGKKVKK